MYTSTMVHPILYCDGMPFASHSSFQRLPSILRLLKEEVSLPYRAEYSRWALVDLLRRFIAIILIVIFPSKPVSV